MPSNVFFGWTLDDDAMVQQLDELDARTKKVKSDIEIAFREHQKTANQIMGGLRGMWGIAQGAYRAMGGTISMTTRLVVSAVMGAVQTLAPILAAGSATALITENPVLMAQSIMGMMEVGTSLTALAAFSTEQKGMSQQLRGVNMMFSSMSSMLNSYGGW